MTNGWENNQKITPSRALLFHLAMHALGIFGFAYFIGMSVNELVPYKYILSGLEPFYSATAIPQKIPMLVTYVAGIALSFLWLVVIYIAIKEKVRINALVESVSLYKLILSGLFGLIVSLLVICGMKFGGRLTWEFLLFIWAINFLYPIFGAFLIFLEKNNQEKFYKSGSFMARMVICLTTIAVLSICLPLVFGEAKIKNDFYDIPEKTIVNGVAVDNHQFINERHLFGLTKYDPRVGADSTSYDDRLSIEIPDTMALQDFLSSAEIASNMDFLYDKKNGKLVARAPISKENYIELWKIVQKKEDKDKLLNLYYRSNALHRQEENKFYSKTEVDFIKKNQWELSDQTILGRFFYHHSYMMAPIFSYVNGMSGFLSVYGVGYTKAYAEILKVFNAVNLQSYLKILYGSYIFYYFLFVFLAFKIFKKWEWVGLAAAAAALPVILQSPETFLLAPGFSPLRHLWDVLALFFGLLYLRRGRWQYLFFIFLSLTIATWWNLEFGLFLFIAVAGVCFEQMRRKYWLRQTVFLITLALGQICAILIAGRTVNPLAKYMLIGFGSPTTPLLLILIAILGMGALGIALLFCKFRRLGKSSDVYWQLALGIYIYVAQLMVYVLWNPAPNHLIGVALPWLTMFLLFLIYMWPYPVSMTEATIQARHGWLVGVLAVFLGIPIVAENSYEWYSLNRVYTDHVQHEFKFPGAEFVTDMEPKLFKDSVAMVQKYSPNGCIALLSKYDVILPILAGRCSVGPFVTSADIFITEREGEILANSFIKQADVIYVDSDIDRPYIGEIPDKSVDKRGFGVSDSGRGRAVMFTQMKGVFEKLANKYQLEERGPLISVYRRKQ